MATHLGSLLRFAQRLTWPDKDLASDLVQEAVLKGFRQVKTGKLELTSRTSAWLKQAIYLEFLLHRRNTRTLTVTTDEFLDNNQAKNQLPFEEHINPEIIQALADLPEEQRILVILVDIEQLEYQEVSDLLQIPLGTVRSRLSRARWKLANQLHHLSGNNQ
ncbi:MAG: RNA polymerase sigma factor [Fimbriimonadaceae bacterium]